MRMDRQDHGPQRKRRHQARPDMRMGRQDHGPLPPLWLHGAPVICTREDRSGGTSVSSALRNSAASPRFRPVLVRTHPTGTNMDAAVSNIAIFALTWSSAATSASGSSMAVTRIEVRGATFLLERERERDELNYHLILPLIILITGMGDYEPAEVSENGRTARFGARFRAKCYKGRRSFSTTTAAEQGWPLFVSTSDQDRLLPQKCLGCYEATYKYVHTAQTWVTL